MKENFRIAVLGIGGIGGYFGGKLAAHFAGSQNVEIIFIARGENAKVIKHNGLRVITRQEEFSAVPHLVTNEAGELGVVDLLLICTKSYDLAESILKFRDCINKRTSILPLLNGVDNANRIKDLLPDIEVWNGCAYIASRLVEPGVIKVESDIRLLQFGSAGGSDQKLERFEQLLKAAGIEVELTDEIEKKIWEKFIFISSLATLTSFLDTNAGGIVRSPENQRLLMELIREVTALAHFKNIKVEEDIENITFERIKGMPGEITSSMHSDFIKGGQTELESLTGYVARESKSLNLAAPVYERLYEELKRRN